MLPRSSMNKKLIDGRIDLRIIHDKSVNTWRKHTNYWEDCNRCNLAGKRHRVSFYRGVVPCDVLFIGEAPGQAEDICGRPFVGYAGHLLQDILKQVSEDVKFTFAITNLVSCIPLRWSSETKQYEVEEPTETEIASCSVKLAECVYLADPKLVVLMGYHAKEWYPRGVGKLFPKIPVIDITHPTHLLDQLSPTKELLIDNIVLKLIKTICTHIK